MNDPRKHHYIPAFYLKRWATNGFLCEMRSIRGKLIIHSKAPDATGFKENLYKIEGVAPQIAQHFERIFLQMVDTEACTAMRSMVDGNMDLPPKQRDAWIRFMLSLLFRNPEAVAELRGHVLTLFRDSFDTFRSNYEKLRPPDFPPTLAEFDAASDPSAGAIAASNFLQRIINSEGIANRLVKMGWGRLHLWRSRHNLLTSDRPLCLPMHFPAASVAILIPISPRVAFTAAEDARALKILAEGDHTTMARQINQQVASQARQYVWSLDDRPANFVRKHISTLPDRKIISDEAKELGRKQARGEA